MEIMRWALKTCFTSTSVTIYFAFKIFYRIRALVGTAKQFVTQYFFVTYKTIYKFENKLKQILHRGYK